MSRLTPRDSANLNKTLFGIDGCRGGWVVANATTHLTDVTFEFASDLRPIFETTGTNSIIAIDIPIGLPETEPRLCDGAARRLLGWPRSSSVFSPPCRKAIAGKTFKQALQLNRAAMGVGISKQAFHITTKIREVDVLMTRQRQQYVREVHPEVSFAQLNGGALSHNKKTRRGCAERIALLRRAGLEISEAWLVRQRMKVGARVSFDDLIDALACLVTAFAIQNGLGRCLGLGTQRDAKGLAMEIVCC
jgi:predicted RNase H-like nuclease